MCGVQQDDDLTVQVNRNELPTSDEALPLSVLPLTLPVKLKALGVPAVPTQSNLSGELLNFGFLKDPLGLHEHPRSLALMPDTTRSKLLETVPGETNWKQSVMGVELKDDFTLQSYALLSSLLWQFAAGLGLAAADGWIGTYGFDLAEAAVTKRGTASKQKTAASRCM